MSTTDARAQRSPDALFAIDEHDRRLSFGEYRAACLRCASGLAAMGLQHFTMDFGHPLTPEHVHRFAEQVIDVVRAG